jgi:hypothetical protein
MSFTSAEAQISCSPGEVELLLLFFFLNALLFLFLLSLIRSISGLAEKALSRIRRKRKASDDDDDDYSDNHADDSGSESEDSEEDPKKEKKKGRTQRSCTKKRTKKDVRKPEKAERKAKRNYLGPENNEETKKIDRKKQWLVARDAAIAANQKEEEEARNLGDQTVKCEDKESGKLRRSKRFHPHPLGPHLLSL